MSSGETTPRQAAHSRRWLALAVLLLAAFMDLLDGTIVFVALPRIAADLGATYAALEWVVAAYTLAFAVGLITGGRLGDIFGRRRIFLAGMAGFTAASGLAGMAPTSDILIAARVLQGLMAAAMVPQVLAIVQVIFPAHERVAAFALYGITLGMAAVIGPLLGGALTEFDLLGLGWRPIFLINLPVGLVGLAAAGILVNESRSPNPLRLDLVGVALGTLGVLLLVFPLVEGRVLGWPAWLLGTMAMSLLALALFAVWERQKARRDRSPLVEPSLFAERGFVAGLLVSLAFISALGSFWFVLVLWLQVGLGYSPLTTAMIGVGSPVASMLIAPAAVKLAPRLGRSQLSLGFGLGAAAIGLLIVTLQLAGEGIAGWHAVPSLVLLGLALGLVNPVIFDFILAAVPAEDAGSASGVVGTVQQVGGAVGIAVVGALFFAMLAGNAAPAAGAAWADIEQALIEVGVSADDVEVMGDEFVTCFTERAASNDQAALPASCRTWETRYASLTPEQLNAALPAIGAAVDRALASTFATSLRHALWYHLAAYVAATVLTLLLPRRARSDQPARENTAEADDRRLTANATQRGVSE